MKTTTPLRAIRAKCIVCSNNQHKEILLCPIKDCPLYIYRMGKNPKRKGMGGDIKGNIEKIRDSMKKTRT